MFYNFKSYLRYPASAIKNSVHSPDKYGNPAIEFVYKVEFLIGSKYASACLGNGMYNNFKYILVKNKFWQILIWRQSN